MTKKKILHITFDMAIGGTEQVICQLVENTNREQFTPSILCIDGEIGDLGKKLQQQGTEVISLARGGGLDLELIKGLRRIIKQNAIDIVHCHQYTPYIYGLFAAIATGSNVIFTEHGRFYPDYYKWKRYIINPILSLFTKSIISISGATKDALVQYENFPRNKIDVIYNGFAQNLDRSNDTKSLKNKLQLNDSTLILGTIARLDPIKNQKMMISSIKVVAADHPNIKLIIVGDGPYRKELEQHVKDEDISDNVLFTGFIVNPQQYFQIIDIFLLSSLSEGTSMTILEAMACAKPCVVTDVGGNPEIITNEINGYLTPNKDITAFAAAICKLIESPEKRISMGAAALISYQDKFTVEKMIERYENVYHECH